MLRRVVHFFRLKTPAVARREKAGVQRSDGLPSECRLRHLAAAKMLEVALAFAIFRLLGIARVVLDEKVSMPVSRPRHVVTPGKQQVD